MTCAISLPAVGAGSVSDGGIGPSLTRVARTRLLEPEQLQAKPSLGVLPAALDVKPGVPGDRLHLRQGIFVGVFRMDRLAGCKLNLQPQPADRHALGTSADEVH